MKHSKLILYDIICNIRKVVINIELCIRNMKNKIVGVLDKLAMKLLKNEEKNDPTTNRK